MDPFARLADLGRVARDPDTTLRWSDRVLAQAVAAPGVGDAWLARAHRGPRLLHFAWAYRDAVFALALCALREEVECARAAVAHVALAGDPAADRLLDAMAKWCASSDKAADRFDAFLADLATDPLPRSALALRARVFAALRPRAGAWWLDLWVPALVAEYQREHPARENE